MENVSPVQAAPIQVKSLLVGTGYVNEQATGIGTVFHPSTKKIYCVLTLTQRVVGSRFKGVWVAVGAGGVKNHKIGEYAPPSIAGTTMETAFSLPRAWPVGKYRVDWLLDGKPLQAIAFTVK